MKRRSKELFLSILGILLLVVITTGVTFAFFRYIKEGTTENTITTSTITFLYTEVSGEGRGISIHDAFPVSDAVGKAQVGEGNVFDFKVASSTSGNASISYEITARKKVESTLDESVVKLYLTKVSGINEEEVLLANFNTLTQTSRVEGNDYTEKTLYNGIIPARRVNYEQDFRLRMWIDSNTSFNAEQDENGNTVYPYNNKSFSITVNVYANAKVITNGEVLEDNMNTLSNAIFSRYAKVYENPTLTDSSSNTTDQSGLYKSTLTNSGDPTYYFRGNVENYLDFVGYTWRVVRVNEDGTIRIVMQDGINYNATYPFNSSYDNKDYMYYTNSNAKTELEAWYNRKVASNEKYLNRIATGDYYCEQAKVSYNDTYIAGSGADMVVYSNYTNPNFKCENDANGHGLVNASIGLLSYDEALHAGAYYYKANDDYYLFDGASWWTMSPVGFSDSSAYEWYVTNTPGGFSRKIVNSNYILRAVLNLKADTIVTGLGTSDSHWVIAN